VVLRDSAGGSCRSAGIARATDAGQRDGVVPVGQFGAHRTRSIGVFLPAVIVDPQHPTRRFELGRDDRQDDDVD
jgi:hypothetical protein